MEIKELIQCNICYVNREKYLKVDNLEEAGKKLRKIRKEFVCDDCLNRALKDPDKLRELIKFEVKNVVTGQ